MLGTKIIEEYTSVEPPDLGAPSQSPPSRGLTVRPSKSSGLRIVTTNKMVREETLRVVIKFRL